MSGLRSSESRTQSGTLELSQILSLVDGCWGGAGGKGQFQPIQRKMDLVEKTLRVFLNLVIVRSYTSSGPGKNKLLHKVKKAR